MNILVLSWRDPKHPLAGGAEQVMHEHMKGWIAAGHQVTLFSSKFRGSKNEELLDGIRIIRQGSQFIGVQIAALFWYLFSAHPKFDLVVDQFHGIPFFTPFYVTVPKLAVLQEVAKEVWFKNDLPHPLNWLVGIIGYSFEPFIFFFYRKIPFMVGSLSAKEDLSKMGIPKNEITVIQHGIIVRMPKPMPPKENTKTVVFLGALAKDKGIEEALKVFSLMNKEKRFNFWIIGKGGKTYLSHLKTEAEKLGLSDCIKFWGFVPQEKKFELLARAHILLNPSIREGFGLVNIEANTMGTPVVAYKVAGCVDSVADGKSGILVNKGDIVALSEKTLQLLGDAERYRKFSLNSKDWAKQFNWKKSEEESRVLVAELLNAH